MNFAGTREAHVARAASARLWTEGHGGGGVGEDDLSCAPCGRHEIVYVPDAREASSRKIAPGNSSPPSSVGHPRGDHRHLPEVFRRRVTLGLLCFFYPHVPRCPGYVRTR
jgi:hypothetical protein